MGQIIAGRWSKGNEFVLAAWEDSVTQRGDVVTLARGEAALERRKGWNDANWVDANLTALKWKKSTWSIPLLQLDGEDLKATMS
jgi:hypothetical protein